MSVARKRTVTCPNCGATIEVTIWESLNADIDPQAKDKLLNGDLFGADCPKCKKHHNLVYPMLYHDMTHKVMVDLVLDGDMEKSIAEFRKAQGSMDSALQSKIEKDYRYRFVTNQNDLREKAMIFDAGMDDRVTELMKVITLHKVSKESPDAKVEEIHFFITDKDQGFDVICEDGSFSMNTTPDFYDSLSQEFKEKLDAIGDVDYQVDNNWVMEKLLKQ